MVTQRWARRLVVRRIGLVVGAAVLVGAALVGLHTAAPELVRWGRPAAAPASGPPREILRRVASATDPFLVTVMATRTAAASQEAGTGIVLTGNGEVLTSHHVVKGADTVQVTRVTDGRVYPARVLGYDAGADIALLVMTGAAGLPQARLGNSRPETREAVAVVGNPRGGGTSMVAGGRILATNSSVMAVNGQDYSRKRLTGLLAVSALVRSGQSGGALTDRAGSVIGVVAAAGMPTDPSAALPNIGETNQVNRRVRRPGRAGEQPGGAVSDEHPGNAAPDEHSGGNAASDERPGGYAVPIDTAMRVVSQIRTGRCTDRVHVGPTATLGALTSDAPGRGARIDKAITDLPAARAGLLAGEVITSVDTRAISTAAALNAVLGQHKPHDIVTLGVSSPGGASRMVRVALALGTPS